MMPLPSAGRRFTVRRTPGLADIDPHRRMRLDALARLLQDVATADGDDVGLGTRWVVRRGAVEAEQWPQLGERLELTTFCSGLGPRWAERRTVLVGEGGARVDAAVVWVWLDAEGRPAPLSASFRAVFAEAAAGRTVKAGLRHGRPPAGASTRRWEIRHSDLDVLGHVNNAATWEAVVDELERWRPGRAVQSAEIEYPGPLEVGDEVWLHRMVGADDLHLWMVVGGQVRASAVVRVG